MIYRFTLISDEADDFIREIQIDPEATFYDFHEAIVKSVGYTDDQMTSFFICDYDWEKEKVWQYKKLEKANNEDVFQWSIILKSENKCIGQASCQKSYDEFGNENSDNIRDVGWFLDFNYHGMGYGSEAARAMIDYMFKEVQIDKIETCAATDNLASWKIMEKLGFHRTNKIKKVKYTILTEEVDCYCYEITREEYLNLVSK